MFETVTVSQAIQRGRKMIVFPMMLILWGSIALGIYLAFGLRIILALPAGVLTGMIGAILYRNFMITRWRLWAFENVRNVNQLKREAAQALLIPTENNFFEKMEIRSAADKVKWSMLQERFKVADVFQDDPDVPPQTIVHISIIKKMLWVLVFSVSFFTGLFLVYSGYDTTGYVFGVILILFGGGFIYMFVKDAFNRAPQVIIDDKGMSTSNTPFYTWQQITGEQIVVRGSGKNQRAYLQYHCPTGNTELQFDDFTIFAARMEKLLRVYRGRAEGKNRGI